MAVAVLLGVEKRLQLCGIIFRFTVLCLKG